MIGAVIRVPKRSRITDPCRSAVHVVENKFAAMPLRKIVNLPPPTARLVLSEHRE